MWHNYCFKCSNEYHRPCSCEIYEKWKKLKSNSKNGDLWIETNTKECPHCHQRIERILGCNLMLCDKKAGDVGKLFVISVKLIGKNIHKIIICHNNLGSFMSFQ